MCKGPENSNQRLEYILFCFVLLSRGSNPLSALLAWLQSRQLGAGAAAPPLPQGVSSLAEWYTALIDAGAFHKAAALPQAIRVLQLAQNPAWVHAFLGRLDLKLLASSPEAKDLMGGLAGVPGVGADALAATLKKGYLALLAKAISPLEDKVVSGGCRDLSVSNSSYGGYGYGYGDRYGYGGGADSVTQELTKYSTPYGVASALATLKTVLQLSRTLASILPDGGAGAGAGAAAAALQHLPIEAAEKGADAIIGLAASARQARQQQRADAASSLFLGDAIVAEVAFALYEYVAAAAAESLLAAFRRVVQATTQPQGGAPFPPRGFHLLLLHLVLDSARKAGKLPIPDPAAALLQPLVAYIVPRGDALALFSEVRERLSVGWTLLLMNT